MPGGDRTGPMGMGALTGRGAGYCRGNDKPGFASGWFGRGRGAGRGGFGRGWRNQFFATGLPGWARGYGIPPESRNVSDLNHREADIEASLERVTAEIAEISRKLSELKAGKEA